MRNRITGATTTWRRVENGFRNHWYLRELCRGTLVATSFVCHLIGLLGWMARHLIARRPARKYPCISEMWLLRTIRSPKYYFYTWVMAEATGNRIFHAAVFDTFPHSFIRTSTPKTLLFAAALISINGGEE